MKKLESGRSMVEMLGVLAIIGVLSVGGIAGYSLSMRRHRANGVVDLVSKYALITYNQCQQKILNGELTGENSLGVIRGCTGDQLVSFDNAGIGNIPSGVASFVFNQVESADNTDVDTVNITVSFHDSKLCQAVASIAGTGCKSNTYVAFKIKQN